MKNIYAAHVVDMPQALPDPGEFVVEVKPPEVDKRYIDHRGLSTSKYMLYLSGKDVDLNFGKGISAEDYAKLMATMKFPDTTTPPESYYTTAMANETTTTSSMYMHEHVQDVDFDRLSPSISYYKDEEKGTRVSYRQDIEKGIMPPMANGFKFVTDRRPEDVLVRTRALKEQDPSSWSMDYYNGQKIPAQEYTEYFSRREIPIADEGHFTRDHDLGHVRSYIKMFEDELLADTVATAATNQVGDLEGSKKFAAAMDHLGDNIRNLFEGHGHGHDVISAGKRLSSLVDLAHPNTENDPEIHATNEALFTKMWDSLGLKDWEKQATRVRSARSATFDPVKYQPLAA
jgi:hypothetical protein